MILADSAPILKRLREILSVSGDRVGKARRVSAALRETCGYRWVGLYDVSGGEIRMVAWSGPQGAVAPCSVALPDSTPTKIVVPVRMRDAVVGLLHVESGLPQGFGEEDSRRLEECAAILEPLWS